MLPTIGAKVGDIPLEGRRHSEIIGTNILYALITNLLAVL